MNGGKTAGKMQGGRKKKESVILSIADSSFFISQIEIVSKGNVDVTINSPAGGNAHVTGTITYSETTQRTDWFLSFGWWSY